MPDIGAQIVIDRYPAGLGGHPGRVQRQVGHVDGPADGEEHGVGDELAQLRATPVVHPDGVPVRPERLDPCAGVRWHTLSPEGPAELGGNTGIGGRNEHRPRFEQGHGGPQVLEDRGDLAAGVGPADHRDPFREGGQGRNVLVGERQVSTGDRQPGRVAADGQDYPVRGPGTRTRRGHRMRVGEAGRAAILDQIDAMPPEMAGQVFLVVGVAGHPIGVGHHDRQVGHRPGTFQAENGPRGPVARQPGRAGQGAHRRRPAVEAGAANLPRLEQGDLGAQFTGLQGRGDPGRPAADHQQTGDVAHDLSLSAISGHVTSGYRPRR